MTSLLSEEKQWVIECLVRETRGLPGALAELGVYKGGNALRMAQAGMGKKIYLFDTFEGIPEKGPFDVHNVGDFSDVSLEEIRKMFEGFQADFRVGKFPETTKGIEAAFTVVHIDADQYEATKAGLDYFWPRLVYGGYIVLDDYAWPQCPGVMRAVDAFKNTETGFDYGIAAACQLWIKKVDP